MHKAGGTNKPALPGGQDGQYQPAGTGLRVELPGPITGPLHEYDFVNGTLVDEATLERAVGLARKWNVTPHDVLLANGWIRPRAYYSALANNCGAPFFEADEKEELSPHRDNATPREAIKSQLLKRTQNGRAGVALAPTALSPLEMKNRLASNIGHVSITTPQNLRAGIQKTYAKRLMSEAVYGLTRRYPGQSAGEGLVRGQRLGLATIFAVILISAGLTPILTLHMLAGLATMFFGMVVALTLRKTRRASDRH